MPRGKVEEMRAFAENTKVSIEKSKAELDTLLAKAGASSRGVMSDDERGIVFVAFVLSGGKYRLQIPLPRLGEFPHAGEFPKGWLYWPDARQAQWRYREWEQASRSRWRQVILFVRSKLEIVRLGLSSAEREFMADMVLANGRTVGELLAEPDVAARLLPAAGGAS